VFFYVCLLFVHVYHQFSSRGLAADMNFRNLYLSNVRSYCKSKGSVQGT